MKLVTERFKRLEGFSLGKVWYDDSFMWKALVMSPMIYRHTDPFSDFVLIRFSDKEPSRKLWHGFRERRSTISLHPEERTFPRVI